MATKKVNLNLFYIYSFIVDWTVEVKIQCSWMLVKNNTYCFEDHQNKDEGKLDKDQRRATWMLTQLKSMA